MDRLGYFHSQLGEARRRLAGARVDGHIASPLRADGATAICRR